MGKQNQDSESDTSPEGGEETIQENRSTSTVEINESDAGGDINVDNKTTQINEASLEAFPSRPDPFAQGWRVIIDLLTSLPISTKTLDRIFAGGVAGGVLLFYFSLTTIFGVSQYRFSPPLAWVEIPYANFFFGASLMAVLLGAVYHQIREKSECPRCGEPVGLDVVNESVFPELSDKETEYGEQTLVCEGCGEEVTRRFKRSRGS